MAANPSVAVIGGGLAGLCIARQLNLKSPTRGVDVAVLEASPRVGGVIGTTSVDGFLREHAANGALGEPRGGAAELARDLGIEMIAASPAAKRRWIYAGGALREVPGNPLALARSDLLSARAKLRLLAEPVVSPLPGEPTVADFFRHRLGDEVHDRVVSPFVSGIYAGDSEELSMLAAFPSVAKIASRGGLFRGLVSQQLGARRRGEPSSGRGTSAPAAGMAEISRRLAEKLGGRVQLESPVASVSRSPRGVDVVLESGKLEHYDAVVCALPAHAASTLFVDADPELGELLATVPFAPVAVVHLGYERADVDHPLGGFGFLVAPGESLGILGMVFESEIWSDRAPEGCVLLRVMMGGRRSPDAFDLDDEALLAAARRATEETLQIRGAPVHTNLVRWPRAIAQYTVGHRERVERAERLAIDQGVVLAGASYHGVAVNAVTQDAPRVARRVHELLAAPIALLFALLATSVVACSGGASSTKSANGDGGARSGSAEVAPTPPAVTADASVAASSPGAFRDGYRVLAAPAAAGKLEIVVVAANPPARAVSSAGRDACGTERRPPLVVHTLGGVAGAVVRLENVATGSDAVHPDRLAIQLSDCRVTPMTAAVGRLDATLLVTNLDERRSTLSVSRTDQKTPLATLPMVPVGRSFDVALDAPGIYEIAGKGIDHGYVVVADTPYIGVTNNRGELRMDAVEAGEYEVTVWHPRVRGKSSITATASVVVKAGETAKTRIDLGTLLR